MAPEAGCLAVDTLDPEPLARFWLVALATLDRGSDGNR